MKKIILTFASSMTMAVTALFAQNTDQQQNNNNTTQQNTYQQSTQDQQQNKNTYQSPVQQQPQLNQQQNQQQPQLNQQQQTNPTQTTPQPQTYPNPQSQYQSTYPNQNHMMVQPNELPSSMQQTLQGPEYRGWENSTFYRDRTTGEYSFQLREGNETPRTFRFDRNGRAIDEANKPNPTIRGPEGAKDID